MCELTTDFINERNRMCREYNVGPELACTMCELYKYCKLHVEDAEAEKEAVRQWSMNHPAESHNRPLRNDEVDGCPLPFTSVCIQDCDACVKKWNEIFAECEPREVIND